jgi:hypothetical protein
MKRLAAIILIVVVLLILGAAPVSAAGPQGNGNFGGNGEGWWYSSSSGSWHQSAQDNHRIDWDQPRFIIPNDEAGLSADADAPLDDYPGADTSELMPPMP